LREERGEYSTHLNVVIKRSSREKRGEYSTHLNVFIRAILKGKEGRIFYTFNCSY
jgi:hypothetical protein